MGRKLCDLFFHTKESAKVRCLISPISVSCNKFNFIEIPIREYAGLHFWRTGRNVNPGFVLENRNRKLNKIWLNNHRL